MALNEKEQVKLPPPWLKEVVEEAQRKIEKRNRKMKIKRMKRVNKLPSNYYHNYNKPSVKEMHRQMVASMDEE